jgi:ubiquinone biosynthesis protein Coq4
MKLSPFRTARALYSLVSLVRDPDRLAEVFDMADALATPKMIDPVADALADRDPACARALAERHRFAIVLDDLRLLPRGTLGRELAEHMIANGLDPTALPDLESTDRISFLRAHLYETHDVWHVVTGFGTDWKSEIGLQAFYMAQVPGPLPAMLLAVGALRVAIYEPTVSDELFDHVARGWRLGKSSKPLFGIHWDDLWNVPLAEVQRDLALAA